MHHLNFKLCLADTKVWLRPGVKSDGTKHYEHVLLNTDDDLVVSENVDVFLRNEIGKCYELKEESIGPPKMHLGESVRKEGLGNLVDAWSFSS